jgi:endonuclease YncB( thermonuclease family)
MGGPVGQVRTYPGIVQTVHDGDSLKIDCDAGLNISVRVAARLSGINAAELATPAGKAARAHLAMLAPVGTPVTVTCFGPDKYARWDCRVVTATGVDLAQRMIGDGFAAAWDGHGPAPIPPWPVPTAPTSP